MIYKQIPDDVINVLNKFNFRVIYLTSHLISVVLLIHMGIGTRFGINIWNRESDTTFWRKISH